MAHGTAVAWRMDDESRAAGECRTDDRIANYPASLARAHHTAIVFGRPLVAVVVELVFIEAA